MTTANPENEDDFLWEDQFFPEELYDLSESPLTELSLLYFSPTRVSPTDLEEELLRKILQAVGYGLHRCKMVNIALFASEPSLDLSPWLEQTGHLLAFGLQTQPEQPYYQVHTHGNARYLLSDSLETLHQQTALKKQLWEALQTLFVQK
ncbi:hypothetical protein [Eisenibacter elegans]|uniref:hypothetical protein n=1 Tax=Eisenibacter elegans TaxID=997 RepID=UPI00041F5B84|nr:hypothetical protein [Eisenibacter elegans]